MSSSSSFHLSKIAKLIFKSCICLISNTINFKFVKFKCKEKIEKQQVTILSRMEILTIMFIKKELKQLKTLRDSLKTLLFESLENVLGLQENSFFIEEYVTLSCLKVNEYHELIKFPGKLNFLANPLIVLSFWISGTSLSGRIGYGCVPFLILG